MMSQILVLEIATAQDSAINRFFLCVRRINPAASDIWRYLNIIIKGDLLCWRHRSLLFKRTQTIRLWACLLICFPILCNAESIQIAAASNVKPTLVKIASRFEQQTNVTVHISSASTGVLAAQILHGAPFDLFFAADAKTPAHLQSQLHLEKPQTYALGQLVFWCPAGAPSSSDDFQQWQGRYVMADPKLAPYGIAAQQVIENADWTHQNQQITATNISQAAHFVASGAVDCGFVSRSLIPENTNADQWYSISTQWHSPIQQQVLVLDGKAIQTANEFLQFALTQGSEEFLHDGYALPEIQL